MGGFISTSSNYNPPPPELTRPWRKVTWRDKDKLLKDLKDLRANSSVLRILLYGPTGTGKSSFINTVQRALLGRNFIGALEQSIQTGASFTYKMKTHTMKNREGGYFPFVFQDMMGLQADRGGIQTSDITKVLKGHINDGYTFNAMESIKKEHAKYNPNPKRDEKIHCLVCVLPAASVSRMDDKVFEKMKLVRQKASELGIPQVIVLTKVDQACQMVDQNLESIYQSRKIKEKAQECSNKLGIPLNNIYPVQNYHTEITSDEATDNLILMALRDIVNFANDYVEQLKDE